MNTKELKEIEEKYEKARMALYNLPVGPSGADKHIERACVQVAKAYDEYLVYIKYRNGEEIETLEGVN